jgi:hypothetical protein
VTGVIDLLVFTLLLLGALAVAIARSRNWDVVSNFITSRIPSNVKATASAFLQRPDVQRIKENGLTPKHFIIFLLLLGGFWWTSYLFNFTSPGYTRYDPSYYNGGAIWGCPPPDIFQDNHCYMKNAPNPHYAQSMFFLLLSYLIFAGFSYFLFHRTGWDQAWVRKLDDARDARLKKEEVIRLETARRLETQMLANDWATAPPPPTVEQFLELIKRQAPRLNQELLARVLALQGRIYRDVKIDRLTLRPIQAHVLYQTLNKSCVDGLRAFARKLPPHLTTAIPARAIFTQTIHLDEEQLALAAAELAAAFSTDALRPMFNHLRMTSLDLTDRILPQSYDNYGEGRRQFERDFKAAKKQEDALRKEMRPIDQALLDTPYYAHPAYLYPEPVYGPFALDSRARFAETWIVAPPGRGKTNLLHNMIAEDRREKATIVLMDSKGDLINAYKGYDDVVLIEPSTVQINPFQLGSSTRTLDFLEYIFSALLETKLTSKQTTLFRCVLALMLQIPNATIETFRKVLVNGWKDYEPYVMQLDEDNRDFFYVEGRKSEFDGGQYGETKQEVLQRLRLLVSNHYLKQIFTATTSNTDFFKLLDSHKTIIIDNSKDELGENGAEFFGRFFVALVWMAAVSRSKLREDQKVPVYFYIDECHTVIKRDTKVTTILDECRSQKIALILAHQRIGQIEPNVMDALNNCAIRIANSDDDAEALAKRFRVEASALRLPVGSFACFVRDQTAQARTVSVPEFDMSQFPPAPQMAPPPLRAPEPPKTSLRIVPKDDLDFG